MPAFTGNPHFSRVATDPSFKGWTVSVLPIGGWFGSLINGYIFNKAGRRWAIICGSTICLFGAILTTAAMNPAFIFAGRFLIGMAVGMLSTAVPTFESELAPAGIRGTVVALFQFAVTLGILFSYWIGRYGTSHVSETSSVAWRVPLAVQCAPALLLALGVWILPESPRYLVNVGKDKEATEVLAYIKNRHAEDEFIQIEYLEIKAESTFDKEIIAERYPRLVNRGVLQDIQIEFLEITTLVSSWDMFKRTATGTLAMFFQQWTGIDAIVNYAPTVFQSIGLSGTTTSLLATGVVGVINVLATIPVIHYIDKLGRRTLMLIGSTGMLLMLILVAALSATFEDSWASHTAVSWFTVACIWIYIACFGFSWGPCSWVIISEVFPLSTRGPGVALSASSNWMNNFIVSYTVPIMLEIITWKTYLIFICTLTLGALWVLFLLPETRGKSLEEMDLVFGSKAGQSDLRRMEDIARRIGLVNRGKPSEEKRPGAEGRSGV